MGNLRSYPLTIGSTGVWNNLFDITYYTDKWSYLNILCIISVGYNRIAFINVQAGYDVTSQTLDNRSGIYPIYIYGQTSSTNFYDMTPRFAFKIDEEHHILHVLFKLETNISSYNASYISILYVNNQVPSYMPWAFNNYTTAYTDEDMNRVFKLHDPRPGTYIEPLSNVNSTWPGRQIQYYIPNWNSSIVYNFRGLGHKAEQFYDTYFILRTQDLAVMQRDFGDPVTITYDTTNHILTIQFNEGYVVSRLIQYSGFH